MTQYEAVIEALKALGGRGSIKQVEQWVINKYGNKWKDFGTCMADMISPSEGGNPSSSIPLKYRVLKRVGKGEYELIMYKELNNPKADSHSEEVIQNNQEPVKKFNFLKLFFEWLKEFFNNFRR